MSAVYAPLGPWWTLDGPSLALPAPGGGYVDVWTTGEGPSALLIPPPGGSHDAWLPLLPRLRAGRTVHAIERRDTGRPGGDRALTAEDVAVALAGLGARQVVAHPDAAGAALAAASDWPDPVEVTVLDPATGRDLSPVADPASGPRTGVPAGPRSG